MRQNALTVITQIQPNRIDALRDLLEGIGLDIPGNPHFPFNKFTTTHFCRWVVLTEDCSLAFESNYDGDLDAYLDEVLHLAHAGMTAIYSACVGFPAEAGHNQAVFKAYLKENCYPVAAYYIAYRGETVKSVRSAIAVRQAIETFLDEGHAKKSWQGKTHLQIVADIRKELAAKKVVPVIPTDFPPEMKWGATRLLALLQKGSVRILIALVLFLLLPVFLVILPFALIWYGLLRWHENHDQAENIKAPVQVPRKLVVMEDRKVQNQMTHIVNIRLGAFRAFTLWVVFKAINLLAKYVFNEGTLGNIPSIHYARWVMMGKGRRVLFFSNFDGSWENYLGDFIDKAAKGLTAVWSNTQGFPKTKNLVWEGALDEAPFKQWARTYQVPTQIWFSAYPDDSVRNILNNRRIRELLWSDSLSETEAKELLQRL